MKRRRQAVPVKERTELARRLRSPTTPARPDAATQKPGEPEPGTRTERAWVAPYD